MARIRTIKPEFFTSEDIVSLTPLARLFYVSLWCEADREGRLAWKPKTLKMRYLPADDCSVEDLAQELIDADMVVLYEAEGREFAWIPGFKRHQIINNKEAESVLPAPNNDVASSRVKDASCTRQDASQGKEGKERKESIPTRAAHADAFARFWAEYPKKVSKGQAERAFAKLNPDEHLLETILAAVQRAKTREQWRKDGGKFTPHPATWLNAKGWEDQDDGRNGAVLGALHGDGLQGFFAGCE